MNKANHSSTERSPLLLHPHPHPFDHASASPLTDHSSPCGSVSCSPGCFIAVFNSVSTGITAGSGSW
uniref:Uncharacterized protein n=1 Tax=Anguilla anguilla TaxID=7936 RepID=A0A0E9WI74_ANGAN